MGIFSKILGSQPQIEGLWTTGPLLDFFPGYYVKVVSMWYNISTSF